MTTITITFSETVENHVGMEKISTGDSNEGFTLSELVNAYKILTKMGAICEIYNLGMLLTDEEKDDSYTPAYILVARKAVNAMLKEINKNEKDMINEELSYEWDSKMYSRKHKNNGQLGVVNKHARHNVCYADVSQVADFPNGKGTIVAFKDVPIVNHIRSILPKLLGKSGEKLYAEGNKYYDTAKCGIGFHGDLERHKVIGIRVGDSMDLHFNWYLRHKQVGKRFKVVLNGGDLYVMSDKAVGNDAGKSSILTLKHAAGSQKYTNPKGVYLDYINIQECVIPFVSSEIKAISNICKDPNINKILCISPENIVYLYDKAIEARTKKKDNILLINKIINIYENNNYDKKTVFGYREVITNTTITYILVTGARFWPENQYNIINKYFASKVAFGPFVLIEGECEGVDLQSRKSAENFKQTVISMPANWKKYGRAAGPIRNKEMLSLLLEKRDEGYPVEIVYFHPDLNASKGTKDMVNKAIKAGITPINGMTI